MTTLLSTPTPASHPSPPRPHPFAKLAPLKPLLYHRWLQLPLLLGIAATLAYDRYLLCKEYFFKYTDEDQACMWYAAYDLLQGRIAEPSFYGQDYNSCLEGLLAAPLVALHVPYHIACPLLTVILGLLPFLLLAFIAWRRGHALTAAVALLVPLLLPIRYAMICGIPRGFITGIAIAIFPALLLLPPPPRRTRVSGDGASPLPTKSAASLTRSWPILRYFFAAALSLIAFQNNPSCMLLLFPVGIYALITSWREWKFWLFGLAGLLAAAPYPLYVYQFYYVYHPDYVLYLRGSDFKWGFEFYREYLAFADPAYGPSPVFADLVPAHVSGTNATTFLVGAFSVLAALLVLRRRTAGVCAAFAAVFITFVSFGYQRINQGVDTNTASYSYSRMFLAIPVVFVWLFFLINHTPLPLLANTRLSRWLTRGTLAALLLVALHTFDLRAAQRTAAIDAEVHAGGWVICPAVPVEQLYATAREIKKAADATHADLLLVGGGDRQKHLAYAIPALLGIKAMFPEMERRTFLMAEEAQAHHAAILFIYFNPGGTTPAAGGTIVTLDEDGNIIDPPARPTPGGPMLAAHPPTQSTHTYIVPPIFALPAYGQNVYDLGGFGLAPLLHPTPTPENPHPGIQVFRPIWN